MEEPRTSASLCRERARCKFPWLLEITKYDTGTTFLLTEGGLFLIRRPVKEMNKELRDSDYAN